jgi:hypothetical protein
MKGTLPMVVLLVSCVAFACGLVQLFNLRYQVGDVYPEYSSLRSDPLGTMIFYEALEQLPSISARRDFSADGKLPEDSQAVYLHVAALRSDWASVPEDVFQEIEGFLLRGGRLAITFQSEGAPWQRAMTGSTTSASSPKKSPKAKMAGERLPGRASLKQRWGVEFGFASLPRGDGAAYKAVQVANQTTLPLPPTLAWHSGMILTNVSDAWRTIYARGTNAVLIERHFGAGSVVIATDSFFLSNEAMSQDRHADLLAWLVSSRHHIIFDEAHLGIVESAGVATLMRKYRLHGAVASLLVLALLFIWKHSTSFVPLYPDDKEQGQVLGKEASAGLVNLLRRHIAPQELLGICFQQWTKSLSRNSGHSIARVDQAQAILEAENSRAKVDRNPVQAYQEVCRVLKHTRI